MNAYAVHVYVLMFSTFRYSEAYGGPHNDAVNAYLVHCMEKFEALDAESIGSVLFSLMPKYVHVHLYICTVGICICTVCVCMYVCIYL